MSTDDKNAGTHSAILMNSPLARVLVQIRWPMLTSFNLDGVASAMSRALGAPYPLMSRQAEMQVTFTSTGLQEQQTGHIIRFTSVDEAWNISLGNNFLALDTNQYEGHTDFIERLRVVLDALTEVASIPLTERIGYRYTNRVTGKADIDSVPARFAPSVLGGMGAAVSDHTLLHTITETVFSAEDALLLIRSARVRANESIDPSLPPVDEDSWILDLDAYEEQRTPFDVARIADRCEKLAGIAHQHFNEVVTEKFYERYA
ncbi:uncharacterized protein (TIGR04255 family) [Marisediminicola sp. UYEF4]|uniref:TIGR04255 family protein n=1 Tax=Marisediminicola sp. UYEF4 TaxID=1756384 RepID=UPI0033922E6A